MTLSRRVKEVGPDSVGRALRRMAEDLVAERRRVVLLQRENRELRMQLEELQRAIEARSSDSSLPAARPAPISKP